MKKAMAKDSINNLRIGIVDGSILVLIKEAEVF